jgi:hypothetical protein
LRRGTDEPRVGALVGGARLAEDVLARDLGGSTGTAGDDTTEDVLLTVGDIRVEDLLTRCVLVEQHPAVGSDDLLHRVGRVVDAAASDGRHDGRHRLGVLLAGAERQVEDVEQVVLLDAHGVRHRDHLVVAHAGREPDEGAVHRIRGGVPERDDSTTWLVVDRLIGRSVPRHLTGTRAVDVVVGRVPVRERGRQGDHLERRTGLAAVGRRRDVGLVGVVVLPGDHRLDGTGVRIDGDE